MTDANRPPPDFYRVARVTPSHIRQYLQAEYAPKGSWNDYACCAISYGEREIAERAAKAHRNEGFMQPRVVPVRIVIRKVPRQHDFAWALRRMREGKRVRRAGQSTHYLCAKSYGGDLLPNCIRYSGPGGCGDVDDITVQDLTACDWELTP